MVAHTCGRTDYAPLNAAPYVEEYLRNMASDGTWDNFLSLLDSYRLQQKKKLCIEYKPYKRTAGPQRRLWVPYYGYLQPGGCTEQYVVLWHMKGIQEGSSSIG